MAEVGIQGTHIEANHSGDPLDTIQTQLARIYTRKEGMNQRGPFPSSPADEYRQIGMAWGEVGQALAQLPMEVRSNLRPILESVGLPKAPPKEIPSNIPRGGLQERIWRSQNPQEPTVPYAVALKNLQQQVGADPVSPIGKILEKVQEMQALDKPQPVRVGQAVR